MAAITATNMKAPATQAVTKTTLGASDTFAYNASRRPVLMLDNVTAGALTVNIDGSGGTTVTPSGLGSIDVSAGYSTASIGAGNTVAITLSTISEYLKGVITVTGGTGIEAVLLEF